MKLYVWGILLGVVLVLLAPMGQVWAGEPFANAGPDLAGVLNTPILLKGSGLDTDGATITSYKWTQYSGPTAELKDADKPTATVLLKKAEEHIFLLTVSNGTKSSVADTVAIRFLPTPNRHPVAQVKQLLICVNVGERVELDGSLSADPDGDSMIYEWRLLAGQKIWDQSAQQSTASFTPTTKGLILIKFTVSDRKLSDSPLPIQVYVGEPERCPKEPAEEPTTEPEQEAGTEPVYESKSEPSPGTVFKDGGEAFDALAQGGPQIAVRGCQCDSNLRSSGTFGWLVTFCLLGFALRVKRQRSL